MKTFTSLGLLENHYWYLCESCGTVAKKRGAQNSRCGRCKGYVVRVAQGKTAPGYDLEIRVERKPA